jgi:hypothetical protein
MSQLKTLNSATLMKSREFWTYSESANTSDIANTGVMRSLIESGVVTVTERVVGNHDVRLGGWLGLAWFLVAVHTLVSDFPTRHCRADVILSLVVTRDALVVVSPCNIFIRRSVINFIISE